MIDLNKFSEEVIEFFERVANEVARETGFIKRERELTGSLFFKGLVFSQMGNEYASLEKTCQTINEIDEEVNIKPESLDERFNESSVKFLEKMFSIVISLSELVESVNVEVLQRFSEVNILDSVEWMLPEGLKKFFKGSSGSASESAIKVQLLFEFLSGVYKLIELTDRRIPDQIYGENIIPYIKEGSLNLFDLGYFRIKFLSLIVSALAYFLCRLKSNVNLYEKDIKTGELKRINLFKKLRNSSKKDVVTFNAVMKDSENNSVESRVICQRVSRKVAIKRRKKIRARAKNHYFPSEETLYRAGWNIMITNADEDMLSVDEALNVYSVRWEIEIIFKLWKSVCRINKVLTENIHRFLTELYAKLIGIVLGNYLFYPRRNFIMNSKKRELSLLKSFSYLRKYSLQFANSLNSKQSLISFFHHIISIIYKFALKTQRSKKSNYKLLT